MAEKLSIYDKITARVLEMIDKGVAPWRPNHNCKSARPGKNIRGNAYRGVNAIMTWSVADIEGYGSNYWLTFNQARELGGAVKKGEKGTPVVFWGQGKGKGDDESGEEGRGYVFAKGYYVFNLDQIEGLDEGKLPDFSEAIQRWPNDPIEACEAIVSGYDGPAIETKATTPCYRPVSDIVEMPPMDRFVSAEDYYSVLFHELAHSTGHESRLDRKLNEERTKEKYGQEELVAEFTAAFICAEAGIDQTVIENSAAYLDGWRKAIQGDVKMLVVAASQAQKAADMILGRVAVEVAN
jgi:antirestriction protein ArdC